MHYHRERFENGYRRAISIGIHATRACLVESPFIQRIRSAPAGLLDILHISNENGMNIRDLCILDKAYQLLRNTRIKVNKHLFIAQWFLQLNILLHGGLNTSLSQQVYIRKTAHVSRASSEILVHSICSFWAVALKCSSVSSVCLSTLPLV